MGGIRKPAMWKDDRGNSCYHRRIGSDAPRRASTVRRDQSFQQRGTAWRFRELSPEFERATGHRLVVSYEFAADLKRRIEAGDPFDVAILPPDLADDLMRRGNLRCRVARRSRPYRHGRRSA